MVSSVTNSLNYLVSASFSDVGRAASVKGEKTTEALEAIKRITPDIAGQQIGGKLPQSESGSQGQFSVSDERQSSLSGYARAKISLGPADEAALFSVDAGSAAPDGATQSQAELQHSLFTEQVTEREQLQVQEQIARRKQSYVAQLYAQTGDITFSGDRFVNQAA